MEIVRRWLRDEIQLQIGPDFNLEREFSNGFKFGKVLEHYGKMPDVDKLLNKERPESKLVNFRRLQPHFKSLDVKLDSGIANKLMTEEQGVALIVLQQLKLALDVSKKGQKSGSTLALLRPPTSTPAIGDGRPGTGTGLMGMSVKMEKHLTHKVMEGREKERHYWLKKQEPREYTMQAHTHNFEAAMQDMQRDTDIFHLEQAEQRRQMLMSRREEHLNKLHENKTYLQEWEREGRAKQRLNQRTKTERQQRDLRVELALQEKRRRKQAMARMDAEEEAEGGILAFEENLRRTQDQAVGGEPTEEQLLTATQPVQPLEFLSALSSTLPPPSSLSKDATLYMHKVKERRDEEDKARRERDRRRRRVLVEQAQTHKDMEDRRREQEILSRVETTTEQERTRASSLLEQRERKMLANMERRERAEQFAATRGAEWAALMEERQQAPPDEKQAAARDQRRKMFEEQEAERQKQREAKHTVMCRQLVSDIVDFSIKAAGVREGNGQQLIPDATWNSWLLQFYASQPLLPAPEPRTAPTPAPPDDDEGPAMDGPDAKTAALVDRWQLSSYLDGEEWGSDALTAHAGGGAAFVGEGELEAEATMLGGNRWLGAIVDALRRRTLMPTEEAAAPPEDVQEQEGGKDGEGEGEEEGEGEGGAEAEESEVVKPVVRAVCVMGAPLAGVKRHAHNLSSEMGMELVLVGEEVEKAVKEYEEAMTEWEEQKRQEEEERAAREEEEEGGEEEGDDAEEEQAEDAEQGAEPQGPELTATAMVGEAIKSARAASASAPPEDALLVELVRLRLDAMEDPGAGCVILGLPTSVNQFGLLHNALAPIQLPSPTPLPPPSRLAPPPAAREPLPLDLEAARKDPRHGALTFLRLHSERPETLRRVKGRLHDPENEVGGQTFHEDNDPPPGDSPAAGRLEPSDDGPEAMAAAMRRYAAYWEDKLALDTFASRLGTMVVEVDASGTMEEATEAVVAAVTARMKELDPPEEEEQAEEEGDAEEEEEEEEGEEDAVEEQEPPEPEVIFGSEEPLDMAVSAASETYEEWLDLEARFDSAMLALMRRQRQLEKAAVHSIAERLREFVSTLREPDGKEQLLQAFQTEFNALPDELRYDPAIQDELRERAQDVQHRLWEMSDASREEAEAERERSMVGRDLYRWLKAVVKAMATMIQEEVARYSATEAMSSRFCGVQITAEGAEEDGQGADVVETMRKMRQGRVAWQGEVVAIDGGEQASVDGLVETRPERPDPEEQREEEDLSMKEEDRALLRSLKGAAANAVEAATARWKQRGAGEEEEEEAGWIVLGKVALAAMEEGGEQTVAVGKQGGAQLFASAMRREEELLRARVQSVLQRAEAVVRAMRGREERLFERMDAVLGSRYKGEMSGIDEAMSEMLFAIETANKLQPTAVIQPTNFADGEEKLSYCVYQPPSAPPPREELQPEWRLSSGQLLRLTVMLKHAQPSGVVALSRLAILLQRAAEIPGEHVLPRRWLLLSPAQLLAFLSNFDPLRRKKIDWRRFVLLLTETLHPPPSLDSLIKLKASVASSPSPLAHIPKPSPNALPLWFDGRPASKPEHWCEVEMRVQAGAGDELVLRGRPWRAVKEVVVEAFSRKAATPDDGGVAGEEVDMEALLLYSCAGTSASEGVDKASKLLGDKSGEVDEELLGRVVRLATAPESEQAQQRRVAAVQAALREARGEPSEESLGEESGEPAEEEEEEAEDDEVDGGAEKVPEEPEPPRKVKISELMSGVKGAQLVGYCFGLEAIAPYDILRKMVWESKKSSME